MILTVLICISDPKLVILAGTGDKLSCGQTQNGINLDFKLHTTFLTVLRCISGQNLVILA